MVAAVQATTGVIPEVAGKPHRPMRELLRARGIGAAWIIGDRVDTDIALARAEPDWTSILVLSGVTTQREALGADHVVPDLAAAVDLVLAMGENTAPARRPVAFAPGRFLDDRGPLLLFAWVARGLVGARELTWRRTLLAIFVGVVFGQAVAILILVRDFAQPEDIDGGQVLALSLPFALIGTMGAIVVLELLFARPRARRGLHVPHPFRALRRRAGIIRRGWQVTRIIARNGLAPLVGLRRG